VLAAISELGAALASTEQRLHILEKRSVVDSNQLQDQERLTGAFTSHAEDFSGEDVGVAY
jgi:hypothetical protein